MSEYPIRIRMSAELLDEFANCEQGMWEDHGQPGEVALDECPSCGGPCEVEPLAYNILQRHKTVIEIRDQAEAESIYWAVSSGTFQIRENGHLRAARRIADALLKVGAIESPSIKRWYPSGF